MKKLTTRLGQTSPRFRLTQAYDCIMYYDCSKYWSSKRWTCQTTCYAYATCMSSYTSMPLVGYYKAINSKFQIEPGFLDLVYKTHCMHSHQTLLALRAVACETTTYQSILLLILTLVTLPTKLLPCLPLVSLYLLILMAVSTVPAPVPEILFLEYRHVLYHLENFQERKKCLTSGAGFEPGTLHSTVGSIHQSPSP